MKAGIPIILEESMRIYEITMDEREPAKLTLNLGALADLSVNEHDLWVRYNTLYKEIQKNETPDELEMGELIYIAYRCAALHSDGPVMTMQEFLTALTDDREEIANVFQKLYGVQEKKPDFPKHSRKQQRR